MMTYEEAREQIEREAAEHLAALKARLPMTTVVLCVRDPDWDNDYSVFEGTVPGVEIFDIDMGRSDLSSEHEFADWYFSHGESVALLREAGREDAADAYQEILDGQKPDDFNPAEWRD